MYFGWSKNNLEMTQSVNILKQICDHKLLVNGSDKKNDDIQDDLKIFLSTSSKYQSALDTQNFYGPFAWVFANELKSCFPKCTIHQPRKLTFQQLENLKFYVEYLRNSVICKLWFITIVGFEAATLVVTSLINELENVIARSDKNEGEIINEQLQNTTLYNFEDFKVIKQNASFLNILIFLFFITSLLLITLLTFMAFWFFGVLSLPLNLDN